MCISENIPAVYSKQIKMNIYSYSIYIHLLSSLQGPKSSFITPEKRAKLRSNPVKVHFAEEVEVNGHSQVSSIFALLLIS